MNFIFLGIFSSNCYFLSFFNLSYIFLKKQLTNYSKSNIIIIVQRAYTCTSGSVVEHRLAKARAAGSNPVSCFFYFNGNREFIKVSAFLCLPKVVDTSFFYFPSAFSFLFPLFYFLKQIHLSFFFHESAH